MTRASSGDDLHTPLTDDCDEALHAFETVVEVTDVGSITLDGAGTITTANERFCELVGREEQAVVGTAFTQLLDDSAVSFQSIYSQLDAGDPSTQSVSTTLSNATGGAVECNLHLQSLSGDPMSETVLVIVNPTTHQPDSNAADPTKSPANDAQGEDLERYKTVLETIHDGVYVANEDYEFEMVNDGYASMVGSNRDDLIGKHISTVVNDDVVETGTELRRELHDGDRKSGSVVVDLEHADGEKVTAETRFAPLPTDDGSFKGTVGVVRDLSDRNDQVRFLERQVRQQRAIADFGQQALVDRDIDALLQAATDLVADGLDVDLSKVLDLDETTGQFRLRAGVGWDDGCIGNATVAADTSTQAGYTLLSAEPVIVEDFETNTQFSASQLLKEHDVRSGISVIIGEPDDPWGVFGVHTTTTHGFTEQDVSFVQSIANILAAALSRAERERELERYETIVETIWDGVYALDPDDNFAMVNDAYCEMTGYDREELLGNHATLVHNDTIQERVQNMAAEMRGGDREQATIELDFQRKDGTSVPAEARFGPYPYDTGSAGRAGVVRDITDRRAWEQQVEMMNDLNEVVREITHALVESNARTDIERLVCERFGTADLYEFAWLGSVADDGTSLESIAEAGVTDYLEGVTITADESETGCGPTGRALREQEPVFITNVLGNDEYEPWHDDARERGYRSVAAIPLTYQNISYGVLTIYSARSDAFGENEQRILSQVGDVIGHAINAIERKEALMADRITEITFRTDDLPDALQALDGEMGVVTVDRVVPLNDGTVLKYHSVREMSPAVYKDALEDVPWVTDIREINASPDVTRFEVVTEEPTASSTLATYGGRLHSITFTHDSVEIEAELPASVDLRQVSDALCERYPGLELVSRNTIDRKVAMPEELAESLIGQLTERQRTALKSAYYAGFFDWPRESAGTDVAASLDVSPATFHEHLRRAQRKIFTTLFEVSPTAD
ncbi:PAS domain S-box protein [Haladaptatus sp. ZSTT2]|uniref:PAS domain S-box protein n=1 Tax=Haladaptatus sp. ZSTT2 TaxID=3120515 RepID=UPI00300EC95F